MASSSFASGLVKLQAVFSRFGTSLIQRSGVNLYSSYSADSRVDTKTLSEALRPNPSNTPIESSSCKPPIVPPWPETLLKA